MTQRNLEEPRSVDDAVELRPVTSGMPTRTLADEAYLELKRRILTVELEPGVQFREADIANTLSLGKTPVREALLRLTLEGLVRVQSRSGYSVAPVTLKNARDVCELRALLEGEAAHLAASIRGGAVEELRFVDARRPAVASTGNANDRNSAGSALGIWLDAERDFHLALARASGNEILERTLGSLLESFARLCYLAFALGTLPVPHHDHSALVDAIFRHEPAEARAIVQEEIRSAQALLIRALLSSESISRVNVDTTPASHSFYLDVPTDGFKKGRDAP
jgi:DNA-binding GntR family transcriptional regulator